MRTPVSLCLTFDAPLYLPVALARRIGAYDDAGLDVTMTVAAQPDDAAPMVLDGRADVCVGGPIDIMLHRSRDESCDLVGFCAIVARDPFALIARAPDPGFALDRLVGRRFRPVTDVETPWLCLKEDLRRLAVDPEPLCPATPLSMGDGVVALFAGELDVVQVFEPHISRAVDGRRPAVLLAASSRGETLYTTLFSRAGFLDRADGAARRLTHALARAQRTLFTTDPREIAALAAADYPSIDPETLRLTVERYVSQGVWSREPRHSLAGFLRLKTAVVAGGWIDWDVPFEACLTNIFAAPQSVRSDPP